MLYIKDVKPGALALSADVAGNHVVVLSVRETGKVLSVLDQCRNEATAPGFTLVHNGVENDAEFDYTCTLDNVQCGFSAVTARVIRQALYAACLKLCRTEE